MLIDEDKQLCPFRLRKQKGKIVTTLSDHNPIILTLNLKKSDIPKFEQDKSYPCPHKPEGSDPG